MTEADEVAATLTPPDHLRNFDDYSRWVRGRMYPDESPQIIDNVAWALWIMRRQAE